MELAKGPIDFFDRVECPLHGNARRAGLADFARAGDIWGSWPSKRITLVLIEEKSTELAAR